MGNFRNYLHNFHFGWATFPTSLYIMIRLLYFLDYSSWYTNPSFQSLHPVSSLQYINKYFSFFARLQFSEAESVPGQGEGNYNVRVEPGDPGKRWELQRELTDLLQRIQRENGGQYSCTASNLLGKTHSKSVQLDIKCESYYSSLSPHTSCQTLQPARPRPISSTRSRSTPAWSWTAAWPPTPPPVSSWSRFWCLMFSVLEDIDRVTTTHPPLLATISVFANVANIWETWRKKMGFITNCMKNCSRCTLPSWKYRAPPPLSLILLQREHSEGGPATSAPSRGRWTGRGAARWSTPRDRTPPTARCPARAGPAWGVELLVSTSCCPLALTPLGLRPAPYRTSPRSHSRWRDCSLCSPCQGNLSEEKTDAITGIGPDTNTADYKVIFHCTSHIQRVPTAISPPGRMYGQCLCQYQGKEISYWGHLNQRKENENWNER